MPPATACSPRCWPNRATRGAPAAIEGALGWAHAMGDDPVVAEITGRRSANDGNAASNTYKPYPCGIVMHAVIDACLALRRDHSVMAA